MSLKEPAAKPKHRFFGLTPERDLPSGYRIARVAIVICFITLLLAPLTLCSCLGFYVVMAISAMVALFCGSRLQRVLSIGLFLIAIAGFIFEVRAGQHFAEQVRRGQEHARQQQGRNQ